MTASSLGSSGVLPPEVRQDFSASVDGPPSKPDRGPAWVLYGGAAGSAGRPTVVAGKLTQTVTPAASYAQVGLTHDCRTVGAKFTLGPRTTNAGSAVIGCWADSYLGGAVPDSPCHLALTHTHAIFGVWLAGSFTQVVAVPYLTPLVTDGTTEYTAEVHIDPSRARAIMHLPDGTSHLVEHPTIGIAAGSTAFVEVFTAAATDAVAAFSEMWADSFDPSQLPTAVAIAHTQSSRVVQWNPAGVADSFVPTVATALNAALEVITSYPPSGKLLVTCSANYRCLSTGQRLFWDLYFGATGIATFEPVTDQPADDLTATRTARYLLVGTPGDDVQIEWRHRALAANQWILQVEVFRPAVMSVEPVL